MTRKKIILVLFFSMFPTAHMWGQGVDRNGNPIPPRSPVVLLPGYRVDIRKAIDSEWRIIWKAEGLKLDFGQGGYREDETKTLKKQQILWTQEQTLNKHKAQLVYTSSHKLIVSFPNLNAVFTAQIHSQRDLADMLLMVATFDKDWYPIDSTLVAPVPKQQGSLK